MLYSDSRGEVTLNVFNLTYNPNPIILNTSSIQDFLDNSLGISNFSIAIGTYAGNITFDEIKYDYAGGNDTINITVHSPDYIGYLNQTNITLWYSSWKYNFPYSWADIIFFLPRTNNSKNISAYGQTAIKPIYNITTTNYGGRNLNLSIKLNQTHSCLNVSWNLSGTKKLGNVLNSTYQEFTTNLEYLNNTKIWFWADLNECNPEDNWILRPYIQIQSYCKGCYFGGVQ